MTRTQFNGKPIMLALSQVALITATWINPSLTQRVAAQALALSYNQLFPQTAQLALTPEQQTQLTQIAQSTQAQILSILTLDQHQQLKTALGNGRTLKDSLRSLGLSSTQRSQIQSMVQSTIPQIQAVLTPEQITQLQSQRKRGLR